MDQLKAMQVFRAVADSRSFTQAAEQLALPRPTVTNAVQALEQQLGVRLLQRTTRKVSLTAEGELYLERCRALLGDLDDINTLFMGDGARLHGIVRVDLPERVAQLVVVPALPAFLRRFPDIQVRLNASDRYADLVGDGIDCAVRAGVLRDSSLVARVVQRMEQINCAAPAYLAEYGRPQTLADLAQHYAVNYFSTQWGRDLPWEYVDEAGRSATLPMRSRVSVSSTSAYLAACQAGLGLVQMTRASLQALLDTGAVEEVLPQWRPPALPLSIVTAHQRHLPPRVRVFVDWLASLLMAPGGPAAG